jgi:glycosyltransferase involved in cell wall biosynthesis
MVEALAAEHDLRVVAPVPWTQRLRRKPKVLAVATPPAPRIQVHHPLYLFPPKLLRAHYGTFLWISCRRMLRKLVASFEPTAFLAYWAHPDGEVLLRAAREAGRPGVIIVGGSDVRLLACEPRRARAILRALQGADAVMTVGHALRDRVIDLGVPARKAIAFRRGVDTRIFHLGDRSEARSRLGVRQNGRMVLWVGRMVPVKGLDVLMSAWGRLGPPASDWQLFLVGDGPMRASLRLQTARLGIENRVVFVGGRPHAELADWYRAADLVALPSLSEGVPNVLLEALACGTPFVASDVGGVSEIGAGSPCVLVRAGDPLELAVALERRLAEPGRASLPAGFTLAESAAAITGVLASAVAARAPRSLRLPC